MNLNCLICSNLFTPHADIRTTPCGHLFHYHCLREWLQRSRTCPQCRSKTTKQSLRKVYLSAAENTEAVDTGVLQNKINNLQIQMNRKEEDIKTVYEKCENAWKQAVGLREEIATQEHRSLVLESATHALKEEIAYFKSKSKDCDKLEEEIGRLKGQLRDMDQVQKKELVDLDQKVKQTETRLKEAQNESQNYKMELSQLNIDYIRLKQEIEAHKLCEAEIKKKIDDLASKSKTESQDPLNPSIRRIIPPLPKLTQLENESFNTDISPSMPEKVQTTEDSDSPYIPAQICVVDYAQAQTSSSASTVTNNEVSIFKQPSVQLIDLTRFPTQGCYGGLGGHPKEELLSSPQPQQLNLKRPTSSSTITPAKFRKREPQNKLDESFDDSQSHCTSDD